MTDVTGTVSEVHLWSAEAFRFEMEDAGAQGYVVLGKGSVYGETPPSVSSDVVVSGMALLNRRTGQYHLRVSSLADAV